MKNFLKISLFAFLVLCFTSCDKDDVNSAPSLPSSFVPADNAVDVAKVITLKWGASIDPEKSMVKYSVFLSTKEDLTDEDIKGKDLTINELAVTLEGHTVYYWKVKAIDEQGNQVESEVYNFTTVNTLPTVAVLADVEETLVLNKVNLKISWSVSTDADADEVKYDVYLSTDDVFEKGDLIAVSTRETEITKKDLLDNTIYNIKVVSKDGFGSSSSEVKTHQTQMLDGKIYLIEGTFTDPRDSHEYKTISINGTTWMAENLAYLPFFSDEDADEKKCSVYGLLLAKPLSGGEGWKMPTLEEAKAHENFAKYGVMYSSYFLDDVAPEGWHVATDEEWMALEQISGMTEEDANNYGRSYRGETLHKFLSTDVTSTSGVAPTNDLKLNITFGGYCKTLEDRGVGIYSYYWANSYKEGWRGKSYLARAFSGAKKGIQKNTQTSSYRMYVRLVKDKE